MTVEALHPCLPLRDTPPLSAVRPAPAPDRGEAFPPIHDEVPTADEAKEDPTTASAARVHGDAAGAGGATTPDEDAAPAPARAADDAGVEPLEEALSPWLGDLLAADGRWGDIARRTAIGLGLCAAFGLAVGARTGGIDLLRSGVGLVVPPAVSFGIGIPALYIVLAVFDAPIRARELASSAASGVTALGLTLAGLAPLTMIYVVTAEMDVWATLTVVAVLCVAGLAGLGRFVVALRSRWTDLSMEARAPMTASAYVFCMLTTVAACRLWFGLLPVLGGGR